MEIFAVNVPGVVEAAAIGDAGVGVSVGAWVLTLVAVGAVVGADVGDGAIVGGCVGVGV
ncbi:MAG TPA: hypothetical protein VH482_14700 [Thermomicrobiales bacterium]